MSYPRRVVVLTQVAVEIVDAVAMFYQLHKLHFSHYVLPLLHSATQQFSLTNYMYMSSQWITWNNVNTCLSSHSTTRKDVGNECWQIRGHPCIHIKNGWLNIVT